MKNYTNMTKRELQVEMERNGESYLGMTRSMMIDSLTNTERARSMSMAELAAYLEKNGLI